MRRAARSACHQPCDADADLAYEVHQALLKAKQGNPELSSNHYWHLLQEIAFALFLTQFELA